MDQQAVTELLQQLAGDFSVLRLILAGLLGIVLGGLLGIVLCVLLARAGWLARRRRGHHLLLKLYFLALPCCGALIGVQAGLYHNAERQVKERIDAAHADVQQVADMLRVSFDQYLAEAGLPQGASSEQSIEGILELMVDDYMLRNPTIVPSLDSSLIERAALKGFEMFRASMLRRAVADLAIEKAVGYTGVSEEVAKQLISTRLAEIISADFVLKIARSQVSSLMLGFYLTVALQLLILLGLVLGECLLARRLGWMPASASQPVEAVLPI
jgi:hypothetical protein